MNERAIRDSLVGQDASCRFSRPSPFSTCPLTHYQMTNFRLFQIERLCRRQFQIRRKWQKVIQTGRKHCGKRRNCSLQAICPFPTVFSKGLFPRGVKRCHCVGWLVVLGLNATLTAKVISWRSVTHICFLAFSHQYYHNFSFQSHRLLFPHAVSLCGNGLKSQKRPSRKVFV